MSTSSDLNNSTFDETSVTSTIITTEIDETTKITEMPRSSTSDELGQPETTEITEITKTTQGIFLIDNSLMSIRDI